MAAKDNDDVYVNDLYRCQEVKEPEFTHFITTISYGLYFLACAIIGDEDTIRIRRQMTELQNEYTSTICDMDDYIWYETISGSRSEGFRFSSSDLDNMMIYRHIRVIHSMADHSMTYDNHYGNNETVLLMECDKTKPGFALLRLLQLGESYSSDIQRSLIPYLSGIYVSSQIWRDENPYKLQSSFLHGPCNSGVVNGIEYDHAFCIHSNTWPTTAYGCINRLLKRQWPPLAVVSDIVRGGFHFVPISSKVSDFPCLEWRMSFSDAEKKLIHSMNHTQFMCYGLLKIFLKESINIIKEIESILCSYYLKTAVFWEILNSPTHWVPHELFTCFWRCLRRLILWVHEEYIPNFFIPENNMLLGKFQPGQKKMLIDHLNILYSEGYSCLLRCPSLHDCLTDVIHMPHMAYSWFDEIHTLQKCRNDVERICEILNLVLSHNVPTVSLLSLETLDYLLHTNNYHSYADALGILRRKQITILVTMYYCTLTKSVPYRNKEHYFPYRRVLTIINRCRIDCMSHCLYTALCLYRSQKYEDVIKFSHIAKTKLQNPYLMYIHTCDRKKYRAAGGEYTPYQMMLRRNIACRIILATMSCIPELRLEHQVAKVHSSEILYFPPLVIAEFLYCLSCYRLGYYQLMCEAVNDLYTLVHYDDNYHIYVGNKATSWQILGICQEMICDYQGAYQSYSNAFHDRYSKIQSASRRRLENLIQNMENPYYFNIARRNI